MILNVRMLHKPPLYRTSIHATVGAHTVMRSTYGCDKVGALPGWVTTRADSHSCNLLWMQVLPIYTAKDRQAALQEAHIMQLLTNPGKTSHSAHLLGSFSATDPKGCECQCLVMDRLYQSAGWVLHYLHQRGRRGLPEPAVKNLTRQLLLFLDDLHRYEYELAAAMHAA